MNQRIQELIKQADEKFSCEYNGDYTVFSKEKFAELIVKECAELNFRELGLSGSESFDVGRMIKQHFGVEL